MKLILSIVAFLAVSDLAIAADPVRATAETLRARGRVMTVVAKIENLTPDLIRSVFFKCHFKAGGKVQISQVGTANNLKAYATTYAEVTVEAIPNATVECEFDMISAR